MNGAPHQPYALGFQRSGAAHIWLGRLLAVTENLAAAILALDVLVVFVSVVWRYFLHSPVDWAEEIARALMTAQVFLGAGSTLARAQHVGIDSLRGLFPAHWKPMWIQLCHWVIVAVAGALLWSSVALMIDSQGQTTPIGLPQWIYTLPVVIGSALMLLFGLASAVDGPARTTWATLAAALLLAAAVWAGMPCSQATRSRH